MNTKPTPLRMTRKLLAGQALVLAGRGRRQLVVAEGEVRVRAPAQWLAGQVLVAPVQHLAAPAVLVIGVDWTVVAARGARVVVTQEPGFAAKLGAWWHRVIGHTAAPRPAWSR